MSLFDNYDSYYAVNSDHRVIVPLGAQPTSNAAYLLASEEGFNSAGFQIHEYDPQKGSSYSIFDKKFKDYKTLTYEEGKELVSTILKNKPKDEVKELEDEELKKRSKFESLDLLLSKFESRPTVIDLPDNDGSLELLRVSGDYVIARKDMKDGIKILPDGSGDFSGNDDKGDHVHFSMNKSTWKKLTQFFNNYGA